jgi:hypothetical protein
MSRRAHCWRPGTERSTGVWRRLRSRLSGVVLAFLVMAGSAACGEQTPPGEAVPAIATALGRVDAAIQSGDRNRARTAVEDLVAETAEAEVAGELSAEQADRVVAAARKVLARLPADDSSADEPTDQPSDPTDGVDQSPDDAGEKPDGDSDRDPSPGSNSDQGAGEGSDEDSEDDED